MERIEMMREAIVKLDVIGLERASLGRADSRNNSRDRDDSGAHERRKHPEPESRPVRRGFFRTRLEKPNGKRRKHRTRGSPDPDDWMKADRDADKNARNQK